VFSGMKRLKKLADTIRSFAMSKEAYARSIGVKIGSGCRIYIRNWGSEPFLISVGDRVTIAAGTRIITHDGSTWLVRDGAGRRYWYAPVRIGSNVFIGMNCTILPGVTIGDNVVIGAGSVVSKDIPGGSVAVGAPARVLKTFDEYVEKVISRSASDQDLPPGLSYEDRIARAIEIQKNYQGRA
jgi:acetyltransferase-like isoleucine patch superfamily enzyme